MTVVLRRASNSPNDEEYMDVSYYFHDGESSMLQRLFPYRLSFLYTVLTNVDTCISRVSYLYRISLYLQGTFIISRYFPILDQ